MLFRSKETDKKLYLLLIEDNPGDVRIIEEVLRDLSEFKLSNVICLSDAFKYLDKNKTDLVLLDLGLPDSQGVDTFKKIVSYLPLIPIIVLTGLSDNDLALELIKTGAQDFLTKGKIDPELFQRSIHYSIERKQLELALLESQANLKALTENTDDRIWSVDTRFRLITSNTMFQTHCQKNFRARIHKGENMIAVLPPESRTEWTNYYTRALNGKSFSIEKEWNLSGEIRYVDYTFNPMMTSPGEVSGIVVSGRDITDRKQSEKELLESKSKYQAIFESTGTATLIVEEDTTIIMANDECLSVTGNTSDELIGQKWIQYVAPESLPEMLKNHQLRRQNPDLVSNKYQVKLVNKKGEIRDATLDIGMIPGTKQSIVSIIDITDQNLAEIKIKESEEKYRNIVKWAPVGIYQSTTDGKFLSVNQQLTEILGYESIDDLLGRNLETDIYFTPSERQTAISQNKSAGYVYNYEILWKKKDGTPVWISLSTHTIKDNAGVIKYFEGFVSDITERKKTDDALKDSRTRLLKAQHIARMGFLEWNLKTDAIILSKELYNIFGIEPGKTFTSPELLRKMAHPDDLDYVQKNLEMAIQDVRECDIDHRILLPDGTVNWVNAQAVLVRDDSGNPETLFGTIVDITSRKQSEELLLINERRYRTFIDSSSDYVFLKDDQLKHIVANKSYTESYNKTEKELLGRTDFDLMPEHFAVACEQTDKKAIATNGVIITEEKWGDKTFETLKFPVEYQKGKTGVGGFIRNISERKRAEEELQFRNVLLSTLQEVSIDGILVMDESGQILLMNQRFIEIWGLPSNLTEDIDDKPILDLVTAKLMDSQSFLQRVQYLNKHKEESSWEELNLVDGRIFERYSTPMTGPDERYYGRVWYFRDITERKKTEEELKKNIALYKLLAENITDTIWLMDLDMNLTYISPSLEKQIGYSAEEIKNLPLEEQLSPDSLKSVITLMEDIARVRANPGYSFSYTKELEVYRKDGSTFWAENTFSLIRDENGMPVSILGEGRDITERRMIEAEIKKLNAELEQRVIDRTAELQDTIRELEAFSYSVSHDLRAPLRAIDGFTSILMEEYEPQLDAEGKRLCSMISHNTHRMGQLIDDLLSFSRISRIDLNITKIDMHKLAGSVYTELTSPEQRERIDFQVDEIASVHGDGMLLRQVWINLISNAIKFSSRREQAVIRISCSHEKHTNVYKIRDNGVGFDMKYIDKIGRAHV